jgi:UDP-N-acetylglucosamine:LPS N-acetylglucosamine transferase
VTPRSVLLVASSGGVLLDLLALRPWWQRHDTTWIAVRAADTEIALAGQTVHWEPELLVASRLRALPAAFRAVRLLRRVRPEVILSSGGGVAVGVFLAARLLRIPTVWIETLNQAGPPSGAARLCARMAGTVVVQRPARAAPGTVLIGELY